MWTLLTFYSTFQNRVGHVQTSVHTGQRGDERVSTLSEGGKIISGKTIKLRSVIKIKLEIMFSPVSMGWLVCQQEKMKIYRLD